MSNPYANFWKLTTPTKIADQDALFELVKDSHVSEALYLCDKLDGSIPHQRKIAGVSFSLVSFSKTEISGMIFEDCKFTDCQFIGSKLEQCEFHRCTFKRTNFFKVQIEGCYVDPRSFAGSQDRRLHANIGVHLYQRLMRNSQEQDQPDFERYSQYYFLRWKRYLDMHRARSSDITKIERARLRLGSLGSWLIERSIAHGLYMRTAVMTLATVLIFFVLINFLFSSWFGLSSNEGSFSLVDSVYYTAISMTTVGYGDITPSRNIGRLFSVVQNLAGFFFFALIAAIFVRRVSA